MNQIDHDFCTCGHEAHQHISREHWRCTVCTCEHWDWDAEADIAPPTNLRSEGVTNP